MTVDGREDIDLAELRLALLQFVVREIRGHAHELGPLSGELKSIILTAVDQAIGPKLESFEAERVRTLAREILPPIETGLTQVRTSFLKEISQIRTNLETASNALISERMRTSLQDLQNSSQATARAVAEAAVVNALDEPSISELVRTLNRRLANLQTTLEHICNGALDEAATSAAVGADEAALDEPLRPPEGLTNSQPEGTPQGPPDPQPPVDPMARAGSLRAWMGGGRKVWPFVTIVFVIGLALLGFVILSRYPHADQPSRTEANAQSSAPVSISQVAAEAGRLSNDLKGEVDASDHLSLLFATGPNAEVARDVGRQARSDLAQVAAAAEELKSDQDLQGLVAFGNSDSQPPDWVQESARQARASIDHIDANFRKNASRLTALGPAADRRKEEIDSLASASQQILQGLGHGGARQGGVGQPGAPSASATRIYASLAKDIEKATIDKDWQALRMAAARLVTLRKQADGGAGGNPH